MLQRKNLLETTINEPIILFWFWTKDGMSFSWTCLPICENCTVITFEKSLAHLKTNLAEYFFLVYELSENLVKTKIIIFNFYRLFIQYLHEASLSLFLQCSGFKSNKNFNILIFRWVSNLLLSSWLTFEDFCIYWLRLDERSILILSGLVFRSFNANLLLLLLRFFLWVELFSWRGFVIYFHLSSLVLDVLIFLFLSFSLLCVLKRCGKLLSLSKL